uniref:Protein COFACTOR ASSEMBLY OF COMPLEX C SUBUNIT B CCB3, chloroplastic n=1 Tax=Ananas comosus var. bracteatus TaxID=296719 RepID=A0A6V7NRI8_ANACO|nr:unnamed protein product [Ananas comosus var. bracteatus]
MALPYTLSPRFNAPRLSSGILHKSIGPLRFSPQRSDKSDKQELTRGLAKSKFHQAPAAPLESSICTQSSVSHAQHELRESLSYYSQMLTIADIDPATAKTLVGITGPFLSAFGFLFILRIVMSWYPKLPVGKFPYVIVYAPTEPFLKVTRKVIPPLGGVDVTPVVWFGLVSFLNEILVGPQGLLVLLSQQV